MPLLGPPLTRPMNLSHLLRAGLDADPDGVALISAEERWSWKDLERASQGWALGMLGLGLRPGDRVASLMPNRALLVIHYLACLKAGLVATPLNYRYTPAEIDRALELSGASILLVHAERGADIAAVHRAASLLRGLVSCEGELPGSPRIEDLMTREGGARDFSPLPADSPAFIFYTSGSTGRPKGVVHTRETLGWLLAGTSAALELTAADVMLPGSSLSHVAAMENTLATLGEGGRVCLAATTAANDILPWLREVRPSVMAMLPAALIALVRDPRARQEDFHSLRLCMSGGDTVAGELEREFIALTGRSVHEAYGMTETGMSTYNPPGEPDRIGSVGRPAPGFSLSIRDEEGKELPAGVEGRLWVRGPAVTVGYWNEPEATAEAIRDGWLDTGDVMLADRDGALWFRGRRKQIIVHDGSNISPQEIEEVLMAHEAVETAGVIGIHDLVHGENVRAYVVLRKGSATPLHGELVEFARARVGYKAPEEVLVLDEMPFNATGKVDRAALMRLAGAGPST